MKTKGRIENKRKQDCRKGKQFKVSLFPTVKAYQKHLTHACNNVDA